MPRGRDLRGESFVTTVQKCRRFAFSAPVQRELEMVLEGSREHARARVTNDEGDRVTLLRERSVAVGHRLRDSHRDNEPFVAGSHFTRR